MHPNSQINNSNELYIGIGSNKGCRMKNISYACTSLRQNGIELLATSNLYKTVPVLSTNQLLDDKRRLQNEYFINCVIKVNIPSKWTAQDCLKRLKNIESELGRKAKPDNHEYQQRSIDLDILLYENESIVVEEENLCIPHSRMHQREFVLKPLMDILSFYNTRHTKIHSKFRIPLEFFYDQVNNTQNVEQVIPIPVKNITNGQIIRYEYLDVSEMIYMDYCNPAPSSSFSSPFLFDVDQYIEENNFRFVSSNEECSGVEEIVRIMKPTLSHQDEPHYQFFDTFESSFAPIKSLNTFNISRINTDFTASQESVWQLGWKKALNNKPPSVVLMHLNHT